MARGTGLPFPKDDAVVQPTPGISAAAYSNAAAWGQIANAGNKLQSAGFDYLKHAEHQAKVGYLADSETEITRKRIELRDQHMLDPDGFDKAWVSYRDGKLSETAPWAVPHIKEKLGREGNAGYGALMSEKRARDERLNQQQVKALADQSADEVIGAAMAGTLDTPDGQATLVKLRAVHASAVSAALMSPDEAELRIQNITSRAGAETVIKAIGDTYRKNRASGVEAGPTALKEAEELLLRTTDPRLHGLSESERYKYFGRAKAEISALETERKQDLSLARREVQEMRFAMRHGIRPDPDMIDGAVDRLHKAGGHADAASLRAAVGRHEFLPPYARQPIPEQLRQFQGLAGALGANIPSGIRSTIAEAAEITGAPTSYMLSTARRESNFDPAARAGTSSAEGLFQFTDATWRDMLAKHGEKHGLTTWTPKTDARASALMAGELAKENGANLKAAGLPVTDATLYLAHFAGAGGATKLLKADPSAIAADILPDAAAANRSVFYRGDRPRTVAETMTRLTGAFADPAAPGMDTRLLAEMHKVMETKAGAEWKALATAMDAGSAPAPEHLAAIIQAATLTGDHMLLETIRERLDRFDAKKIAGRQPLSIQQGAVAELKTAGPREGVWGDEEGSGLIVRPESGHLSPGHLAYLKDLEDSAKATAEKLKNDPIALGAERFPERIRMPAPFDLTKRDAAQQGLAERAAIARFVGENYGDATIMALSQADRTQIAGAIAGPDAQQTGVAFDVLASLPDDNFAVTLRSEEIKEAVVGAVKSNDTAKFTAAMMSLDKMWARAPQEFNRIFGEDIVKAVQDWQTKLRYHTAEELSESLRKRDDPQVRERQKEFLKQGRGEAAKKKINDLVDDLDPSWFVWGPDAPMDARTRDAALGDYVSLYAERYAETLDKGTAHKQAIERMSLYWKRSELNGGRLTLHAPETVYPAVNGSHGWMKEQITRDLRSLGLNLSTMRSTPVRDALDLIKPVEPNEFVVVADRMTESDIASGKPASYLVMMRSAAGTVDMVRGPDNRPLRYWWEGGPEAAKAREEFQRQRKSVFGRDAAPQAPPSIGVGVP